MSKLLLSLLTILLFTSCQKQVSTDKTSEEVAGAAANKQAKFTVCHYNVVTGISKTIEVTQNALASHLAHGDLQGNCSAVLTTICDQDWMVKNLDVDHYRNGDPIPQVTDPTAWDGLTTGAWCYHSNDPSNGAIYGKLYNWYAVNDSRGLAPFGWHIPSDAEWTTVTNCLGGVSVAGGAMKSTGTLQAGTGLWVDPNTGATNSSGFTGLPGGNRYIFGSFTGPGAMGAWFSSTEYNTFSAIHRYMLYGNDDLSLSIDQKSHGYSVRCVRD